MELLLYREVIGIYRIQYSDDFSAGFTNIGKHLQGILDKRSHEKTRKGPIHTQGSKGYRAVIPVEFFLGGPRDANH